MSNNVRTIEPGTAARERATDDLKGPDAVDLKGTLEGIIRETASLDPITNNAVERGILRQILRLASVMSLMVEERR